MSSTNLTTKSGELPATAVTDSDFVTVVIAKQHFGIPVLRVHDVFVPLNITAVPLAPKEVAGVLNLRGRIVTAIDVRRRLGLPPYEGDKPQMAVVVEHAGESYSLMIDSVGEVLSLSPDMFERNPANLDPRWREVSGGIYRLQGQLLVVLEVAKVLDFSRYTSAA
jgi:purine-binding chemotaxis protein CheW